MTLNVALPLLEQLRGGNKCELVEMAADDSDEESAPEKEKEKEKESISYSSCTFIKADALNFAKFKKSMFDTDDLPVSELFASRPELPPEA